MSYSGNSPILGSGRASDAAIVAWLAEMGRKLAPQFAPDHTFQAVPALGQAIGPIARAYGINADILAGQICKESAAGQSAIFRAKWNPSGLGAINSAPAAGAIDFKAGDARYGRGIDAGVKATVAHLLSYVLGRSNPLWDNDPRATAIPAANLGAVKVLSDLDGRWAVPGVGYGAGIAALANQLLEYAEQHGGIAMAADDPNAQWVGTPNFDSERGGVKIDRIILHTTEGGFDGSVGWLQNPQAQASAHYVVSADGKRIVQMVKEADTAWAAGVYSWNQRSINIEQEGYAAKGGFSDGLYSAVAALVARIAKRHNIPVDRAHVIGHMDVPAPNNHTDPGKLYSFDKVIGIAKGGANVPAAKPTTRQDPATGFVIQGGMLAYYQLLESKLGPDETLLLVGRPISNEFVDTDGVTRQAFERQVWEWRKGSRPQQFDILGARLGVDWLKAHTSAKP